MRSQDRENLSKVEHLGVYREKIYVNGYEESGYCIGTYKTKERALEVLDEIQNLIKEFYDSIDFRIIPIYEMPKE